MSEVAEALIRQFFEKNNYKESLEAFNRATVAREVLPPASLINKRTRKLAKANKEESERPFKSLLQVLVNGVSDSGRVLSKKMSKVDDDFVELDREEDWTTEEITRFNRGLMMYDSNLEKNERFAAISKYVVTRSKKECYEIFKNRESKKEAPPASATNATSNTGE